MDECKPLPDGRFFVKALNGGDAESLLSEDFLTDYIALVSKGNSLLCKVLAVFQHPELGQFMAMVNCLPTHVDSWSAIYDLKGSADDKCMVEDGERVPEVHKRCWNLGWMLCEATGRGFHSSAFRLNVSALCGIGRAFRGCLGGVQEGFGGISGC